MKYSDKTFKARNKSTKLSSQKILNFLNSYITINSAIDVGGGVGTWLKTCQELASSENRQCDVKCLDGSYINKNYLVISEKDFIDVDLEQKINISQRFDLAISLEVGEHLSAARADSFVEDLTNLSDVVLFSAAFPYQGGTGHINEQPPSYWAALFAKYNYKVFDIIRPHFYNDSEILSWYKQNMLLFVNEKRPDIIQKLAEISPPPFVFQSLDIIYMKTFLEKYEEIYWSRTMILNRKCRNILKALRNHLPEKKGGKPNQ